MIDPAVDCLLRGALAWLFAAALPRVAELLRRNRCGIVLDPHAGLELHRLSGVSSHGGAHLLDDLEVAAGLEREHAGSRHRRVRSTALQRVVEESSVRRRAALQPWPVLTPR